jgi:hypothetical protein|tara:strand:- start:363 stop:527 length:165 start_codon:yes stop_codon:yes gene_type:complete
MDILRQAIDLRLKTILKELSTRSLSTKEQQEYNDIRNVMIEMGIEVPPLQITLH